jgi:hypothetical protein
LHFYSASSQLKQQVDMLLHVKHIILILS